MSLIWNILSVINIAKLEPASVGEIQANLVYASFDIIATGKILSANPVTVTILKCVTITYFYLFIN